MTIGVHLELCNEFSKSTGPFGRVKSIDLDDDDKMSGRQMKTSWPTTSYAGSSERPSSKRRHHHRRRNELKSNKMLKLPKLTVQIHVIVNMTLLLITAALIEYAAGHPQELASDSTNFHLDQAGGSSYSLVSSGNAGNVDGDTDGKSNEENEDELDFKLMNAAHDRLQAVRNLLNVTRQQIISSSSESDEQPLQSRADSATGSSLHCAHKGRHYASGQTVPIEDQPCLNCTCRMAILQCYLRVCSPIVSLEAHRQRLLASGRALPGDQECRMLRAPNECCPSMRCGDELLALNSTSGPEARDVASSQSRFQSTNDNQHHHLIAAGSSLNTQRQLSVQATKEPIDYLRGDHEQSASSIVQTTTTTIMPFDNLPKLTVINGPAGQRDSILLITSNPQSISLNGSLAQGRFSSAHSNETGLIGGGGGGSGDQRQLVSSAPIIEALLETIYSSAAKQLSGLNLQGSCMINGSLYFEGSAVLPESGSGRCQYCYCIRQKVMCVRPRCHLIISGCTPKYNNEFACCPTSYNCQQTSLGDRGDSTAPLNGTALARLTSLSGAPSSSELLQARLSAVLEAALARVTRDQRQGSEQPSKLLNSPANELDLNEPLTPRQIDGAQQVALGKLERNNVIDLFSILDDRQSDSAPTTTLTSTTTSSTTTTTPRPITTTSTTTSTQPPTTTTTTTTTTSSTTTAPARAAHSQPVRDTTRAEEDEDEEDQEKSKDINSITTTTTTTLRPIETRKKTSSSQADERRASVSNFLEPMNKLGPLMNTPTIPSGCIENGRSYAIGEQIPAIEACKHCYCGPEGLKECKMVECEVMGDHDCRPITQEGHCCPIRYECPPTANKRPKSSNSSSITQCKSATGMENNCRYNETGAPVVKSNRLVDENDDIQTPPTTGSNGAIEPVGNPAVDPTLQLQQLNSSMGSLTDELNQFIMRIRANQTNNSDGASSGGGTVEDSNSVSSGLNETRPTITTKQDYESVRPPENNFASSQAPSPADPLTIPAGMLGIPSIEPETIENLSRNFINHLEPTANPFDLTPTPPSTTLNVQYANGLAAHVNSDHNLANQRDMRSTNAHMLNGNFSGLGSIVVEPSGQPTPHIFNIVNNPSSTPFTPISEYSTQPVAGANGNTADDYLDLNQEDQPAGRPAPVVTRISNPMAANLQAANQPEVVGHTRNLRDEFSTRSRAHKPVEFDDDAILNLINNHQPNAAQQNNQVAGHSHQNDQSNNTNYASYAANGDSADGVTPEPELGRPTTGTPIGLEAERGIAPGSSWLRLLPQWTRTFGQRLSGFDGFQGAANGQHQEVVTLVAQNQSQSDANNQANDQNAIATARSNHQNPFLTMLTSIIASNDQQQKQLQQQAFQPIESSSKQPHAANLVMRPLELVQLVPINASVGQKAVDSRQQSLTPIVSSFQPRAKPFSSPYEPTVGYSEPEIITAPAPHGKPERFDPNANANANEDTKELVVVASSKFARRSDVSADSGEEETSDQDSDKTPIVTGSKASADEVRYYSSLSSAPALSNSMPPFIETTIPSRPNASSRQEEQQLTTPAAIEQPVKQSALGCYDTETNRTYQLNERIPKADGPCKACHCILGREICQPLVCPPRPSERCREEHRPGECCSDWLCGDGLTPVSNLGGDLPTPTDTSARILEQPTSLTAAKQTNQMESAQMSPVATSLMLPSQRALGLNQDPNVNAPKLSRQLGGQERQQANLMMRNPTNNVNFLSALNSRQLTSNAASQQNQFVSNQAQMNQFGQQTTNANQFTQTNQRADQRIGAQALNFQQQQSNLRSSFLPGSSFIGSPILMHPQQFIRQKQHQQQHQNLLRRNDDSGQSQSFNSNSSPFSMRPTATDYQAQQNSLVNHEANLMRFPSMNNAADYRPGVGSQQTISMLPRPVQQRIPATKNLANPQLNSHNQHQQVSAPTINGQLLPNALRTVPLFTTSQPRPVPMYSNQLTPISNTNQRGPSAQSSEQVKAVAESNVLREVANVQMQPDKVSFKQTQMTPVLDSAGFRPIVRPGQSLSFGSADQSNHVGENSIQPPTRFLDTGFSGQTETSAPMTTTTTTSAAEESASTIAIGRQTPLIRFSQELPASTISSGSGPTYSELASQSTSSPTALAETLAATIAALNDHDESSPSQTSNTGSSSSVVTDISQTEASPTSTSSTTATSPTSTTTFNSIDYPESESPSRSSDSGGDLLDSFLRFSECNIKGKVYKLGQPIEEESNKCRRCTCTSTGVDCKSEC